MRGYRKGAVCSTCGAPVPARNRLGKCIGCRTDMLRATANSHDPIRPWMAERVAYYAARAALGLPLFDCSPWGRYPGAYGRSLEQQTKLTQAARRIAAAYEVE